MMRRVWIGMAVLCGVGLAAAGVAQDVGNWRAASDNARAITGDVYLTGSKVSINFVPFTIAEIRSLRPSEFGAVFDADTNAEGSGHLYRVEIPASKRFLRKNALCGGQDTQWMVTYASGHSLQLAFFSGSTVPVLTAEALMSGTDLCGTFSYVK